MADRIHIKKDELESYKQDHHNRMSEMLDQLYEVDRYLKQMDDYLYDEGLANEFYYEYRSQHQKLDNLNGKLWTLSNNIVNLYYEASEMIDKPFKKRMEQFVEDLSLVNIDRYSVNVDGFVVQDEGWTPGDSIGAPSTAHATYTHKDKISFMDIMNSPFTRRMKQTQYELFLEQTGQLDYQVNYETFINSLYRRTEFDYETGRERVMNIITTGLVVVCVGGVVVMTGGAALGAAVPGWVGTAVTVSGGLLTAKDALRGITGVDINGNPLSEKERTEALMYASADMAFMIAGFGLNKYLKTLEHIDDPLTQQRKLQYQVINDVKNQNTLLTTTKRKGNFGEMVMDNFIEGAWDATRINGTRITSLDDPILKGIDGVYECSSPPPKYIIAEAKYGTSKLNKTNDGLQMSEKWIMGSDRLTNAVGPELAETIRDEMILNPDNVKNILINVDETGNVIESILDSSGKKMKN
ncbi:hypothetical protein [Listeria costaricensis]|uniref:hypothetical protein n=1 Tax=Listeria costaricensis TaxID=2026604 RepID=UPI001F092596|nr:hypothetical protein [Listeria costaricensis]